MTAGLLVHSMGYGVQSADWERVAPAIASLASAHHEEATPDQPLAIDWPMLQGMADAGSLHVVVATHDDQVVGYCLLAVAPHPFYGETWATQLGLYVTPEHRGALSLRLIRHVERAMADAGAVVLSHAVPHLSRAGALFEALGYGCRELVMVKRIRASMR